MALNVQHDNIFASSQSFVRTIDFRQIILLSLGNTEHPINSDQIYNLSLNLYDLFKSSIIFSMPSKSRFNQMVSKLNKYGIIKYVRRRINNFIIHGFILTDLGMGELDGLLFSFYNTPLQRKWDYFSQIKDLAI